MSNNPLNDLSKVYMENVAESAVPGKPAERLGAVTGIPKSEQEAAKERLLAKAKAKRESMKTEALDPVGQEDADIDNDGDTDKSDKYLHKRRKAIAKAMKKRMNEERELAEIHSQAHKPHEVPDRDLKKLVAKAVKRIDTDVDGDTDKNDKAKGELGEFIPGVGNKRLYSTTGTKTAKESFSNWRQDLSEVITDESDKPIKEKKVNNKVKINPKLGEALEEIGGTLLEMVEVDEFDFIVESVYDELLEEGYEEDDIEEAIEFALTEAKVTFGHDTKKRNFYGGMVGATRRLAKQKLTSLGKKAKMKAAQAQVAAYNKKKEVEQSAGDVARRTKRTAEIAKKRASEAPKKAKSGVKGFIKRQAQKVVDRMTEEVVDEGIKGERNIMRKAAAKERAAERKERGGAAPKMPGRLGKSAGDSYADYQQVSIAAHDKVTKKNKNVVGLVTKEEVDASPEGKKKVDPQTQQMLARKKQMLQKQQMLDKQRLQLQRQGKLPVGHAMEEVEQVEEGIGMTMAKAVGNPPALSKRMKLKQALLNREINKETAKNKKRKFSGKAAVSEEETPAERLDRIAKEKVAARASAAKKEKEDRAKSASAFQAHKKEVLAKGGRSVDALDSWQKKKMSKEEVEIDEKLNMKKEKMGDVIKDFYKSDAPQFKGKSKEKRREMAIAAKLTAERGGRRLGEAAEDRVRDERQMRGGVDGNTNYNRPPAKKLSNAELGIKPGKTQLQKDAEKKYGKGASAMDIVKAQIRSKHGKGAILDK